MPTETKETTETRKATHDLFSREIRPVHNWHEWLARWQAAVTLEEMLGLLHAGFSAELRVFRDDVREYDSTDRVLFYLTIADGWADSNLLEVPSDTGNKCQFGRDRHGNVVWKSVIEMRQMVALKAFDMLCLNFFRVELKGGGRDGEGFAYVWEQQIASERLFPAIADFFRAEESRFGGMRIRNLNPSYLRGEPSHNEKLAHQFLLNLARFLWGWKESDTRFVESAKKPEAEKKNAAMRARLDGAKPWMVEVLVELGQLDFLREALLALDAPCLAKLKKLRFVAGSAITHIL